MIALLRIQLHSQSYYTHDAITTGKDQGETVQVGHASEVASVPVRKGKRTDK